MEYQYAKLPDGSYAKFSVDKTPEEIKTILTEKGLIKGTPEPKEEPSLLEKTGDALYAGARGLQDALFAGADDELSALGGAMVDFASGDGWTYSERHKALNSAKEKIKADNPIAYGTGEGLSLFAGAGAAKAAGKLPQLAEAVPDKLKLFGAGSVANPSDELIDQRVLTKAKEKLRGTAQSPTNVVDADMTMNSVMVKNNKDIDLLLSEAKKAGTSDVDLAELKGIVTASKRKTAFTNPAERERARTVLGGDAGDYLADLIDENSQIYSKYGSREKLLPKGLLGTIADVGTSRTDHGAMRVVANTALYPLKRLGERRNALNKGLNKLTPVSDEAMEAQRKQGLEGLSKARGAKEKLEAIEFFKGYDVNSPDPAELQRYVAEAELPRLDKLGVKPTGEATEGVGLLGKLYGENNVNPQHAIQAALDVADEQGISLDKVWNLMRHNKKVGDSEFTALVTNKLKDRDQWTVSTDVKFKNRKAHSKRSTFTVRHEGKTKQ